MTKNYKSIIRSIYKYFITFGLLVNIVFFGFVIRVYYNSVTYVGIENSEYKTLERENVLKEHINHSSRALKSISETPVMREVVRGEWNSHIERHMKDMFLLNIRQHLDIMQLRYIDSSGMEVVRVERKYYGGTVRTTDELQDKSDRDYFLISKESPLGKPIISNLDLNVENGIVQEPYVPTLRVMLPLGESEFEGMLIVNLFMKSFLKSFFNEIYYDFKLIDENGHILVSSDKSENWSLYRNKIYNFPDEIFENVYYKTDKITSRVLDLDFPTKLVLYTEVNNDYIKSNMISKIKTLLGSTWLIFVLSLLFSFFFARKLVILVDETEQKEREYNIQLEKRNLELLEATESLNALNCQLDTQNTELLNTQEKLQESTEEFKTLFKGIAYPIVVADNLQVIESYNDEFEKTFVIGMKRKLITSYVTPKTHGKFFEGLKSEKLTEIIMNTVTGERTFKMLVNGHPTKENTQIISFIDIEDEKILNNKLEKNRLLLLEQSKMASLGDMMGNIAHQWRQPLSIISIIATGIEYKSDLNADIIRDDMKQINEQAQYLSRTIDTFRNFLKNENVVESIKINDLIEESTSIVRDSIKNNNIKLITPHINECDTEIKISKNEFQQVILNLINNSKDILKEKDISDAWIKIECSVNSSHISITVEDNGGGVPENIIDKIFEPYFTTKHKSIGTGLGLHMSYRLVKESMNGDIWVENTENGAKFFVEILRD